MSSKVPAEPLTTVPSDDEAPVPIPKLPIETHASIVGLLGLESIERRYVDEAPLGRGGSGEVVSVLDQDLGRRVAMKTTVHASRSFITEAQTSARLEHPNILPVYDLGVDEAGRLFFTMKHVEGHVTLRQVIHQLAQGDQELQAVYTFERRVQLIQQVCQALAYAHDRGVTHRDVKPENILVGESGEVYLADWGIAALQEGGPGRHAGTVAYMSPERLAGEAEEVDTQGDIYSLVAVLYELLTLRHYVSGGASSIRDEMYARLRDNRTVDAKLLEDPVHGAIPPALSYICRRGLARERGQRFHSAQELAGALQLWIEGHAPVVCPRTAIQRVLCIYGRFLDRHRLLGPGLTFVGLVLVLASVITSIVALL